MNWRDLDSIRENWDGPLVIKGILDVEDARAAAKLRKGGLTVCVAREAR